MEKILLILESDAMQNALLEALGNYNICTCKVDEAEVMLGRFRPDVLVLDLFLPGTDGFALMETCRALLPPCVLLLSVLDSDYVRRKAAQLGVDFVIQKPCSMDYLCRHLSDMLLYRRLPDVSDKESLAEDLLSQFHIHAKERVLKALVRAVLMVAEDPDCLLTKDIYLTICKEYGTTTDGVDQAFRRSIRSAWQNRFKGAPGWEMLFHGYDSCPTNGVFISTLAGYLRKKYPSRFRKGS